MRSLVVFNEGWVFAPGFDPARAAAPLDGTPVTLPHNAVELPFSYCDETSYQRAFTYQKRFTADPAWLGKDVVLVFDGAMADSVVYLNGERIAAHADGYTPFEARLTGLLKAGENTITVKIDGTENPAIPPFGARIDYLTYAGIYRDVTLRITAPQSIAAVKVETPEPLSPIKRATLAITIANPADLPLNGALRAVLADPEGNEIASTAADVTGPTVALTFEGLTGVELWDLDTPVLYTVRLALATGTGRDETSVRFGFRAIDFSPTGFRLNGRPLKLRGLNRHQSFPYVGYAMGRAAQERDADILKHELNLNIVRTSHYPQSPYFLDRCDEIGLLVLEEIPGWQHVGDEAWKAESIRNVEAMIRRDWNHPSIILWGVRVNESKDHHAFYAETNRLAHALDATRPTTGVRCIVGSELLEDVYAMNDFILGMEEVRGNRPRTPLRPRAEVTELDRPVPYMVTEFNGHMYPTKVFDQEQRQAEHVLRHLDVLNAAYGDPEIAGAIGWCAFDYNTHKDFGSGDRICHHGVMDMFREPKFAAYAYASQGEPDQNIVLKPVTVWSLGERNHGGVLPLLILTNCDEVEIRCGGMPPRRFGPDRARFPHLPHPPVLIRREDYLDQEFGNWGMGWQDVVFVGYINGEAVREVDYAAAPVATRLEVVADTGTIGVSDSVRVMVRLLDQVGNKLAYAFDPVSIAVEGPAHLLGPSLVSLVGGSVGFWVTGWDAGEIVVRVTHRTLGESRIVIACGAAK